MKRSRAPNFTAAEIMHLLGLVEKYLVIEKKTDGATTKDKQVAWQKLAAEFNSQTKFSPRTVENLQSCYKNQKIKVKKVHSNEKITIKAPLLIDAIEEHGQDWDRVAQVTDASSFDCQNAFQQLVKDVKKEEALHKKEINRTGGGPPPPGSGSSSSDAIVQKVKTLMGPSLEGLYTMYDGDADFMKEQQASIPIDLQQQPIEFSSQENNNSTPAPGHESTNFSDNTDHKRLNVMKKKIDPSLEIIKKGKKRPNVAHTYQDLASDKGELRKAQKILANYQIQHQRLLIELAEEKLQFEKKENEMEFNFLKEKHDLELDILRNKRN